MVRTLFWVIIGINELVGEVLRGKKSLVSTTKSYAETDSSNGKFRN